MKVMKMAVMIRVVMMMKKLMMLRAILVSIHDADSDNGKYLYTSAAITAD